MLDVHHKGKAVVASGTREAMERNVEVLHGYGLWATVRQDAVGGDVPVNAGWRRHRQAVRAGEATLLRPSSSRSWSLNDPERPSPPSHSLGAVDDVLDELEELFSQPDEPDPQLPTDPVVARLLPDAYRDDPEKAGEFRKYTESSLREAKKYFAQTLLETLPPAGGKVKLTGDQARDWMRALNDVRLMFGVRLEVTEDFEDQLAALDPKDPRAPRSRSTAGSAPSRSPWSARSAGNLTDHADDLARALVDTDHRTRPRGSSRRGLRRHRRARKAATARSGSSRCRTPPARPRSTSSTPRAAARSGGRWTTGTRRRW